MDWNQRAVDCHRHAVAAYPKMVAARKTYEGYSKLWTYWSNRAFEAERRIIEVKIIPSRDTHKKINREKEKWHERFRRMSLEEQTEFINQISKGAKK